MVNWFAQLVCQTVCTHSAKAPTLTAWYLTVWLPLENGCWSTMDWNANARRRAYQINDWPYLHQVPDAKLVYNNSPSFNWTLNFRKQVIAKWEKKAKTSATHKANLMSADYDNTELNTAADELARTFQADASREACVSTTILITLPTFHTAALRHAPVGKRLLRW